MARQLIGGSIGTQPQQPNLLENIIHGIGNIVAPRTTQRIADITNQQPSQRPQFSGVGDLLSQAGKYALSQTGQNLSAAGELGLYLMPTTGLGAETEGLTGMSKILQTAKNVGLKYGLPGAVYGATGQGSPTQRTANALTAGAISSVAGPALEKVMGTVLGSGKSLYNTIAKWYVGDEASKDPLITSNLEYGNWQQSRDNLNQAAQKVYQPLKEALSKVNGRVGDFIDAVTTGIGKRDINEGELIDSIAQRTGGELQDKVNALHDLEKLATTPSQVPGRTGFVSRTQSIKYQKLIDNLTQDIKDTMVPGDVLNQTKMDIGNYYSSQNFEKGQAPAYTAAKNYIEKMIGSDADTKNINAQYNKLTDAADFINNRFTKETQKESMNRSPNFLQRFGTMIGAGLAGGAVGLPMGSPYNLAQGATGGGLAMIYLTLKDALSSTPERAASYAKTLNFLNPSLNKLLRQFVLNQAQQTINSQTGASQSELQQTPQ